MKQQVHNLIILDESGSMHRIKDGIIQGFNGVVQSIKGLREELPRQEHFITFVSFSSENMKSHHYMDPVEQLNQINGDNYQPYGGTPLYDALGYTLIKLKLALQWKENPHVLVTILTDGEENSSKDFTLADIKKLIEELTEAGWTFTYYGTEHDVSKAASSLSITQHRAFDKSNLVDLFKSDWLDRVDCYRDFDENI